MFDNPSAFALDRVVVEVKFATTSTTTRTQELSFFSKKPLTYTSVNSYNKLKPGKVGFYEFDEEKLKRIFKKYNCIFGNKFTSGTSLKGVAPLKNEAKTLETSNIQQLVDQKKKTGHPLKS